MKVKFAKSRFGWEQHIKQIRFLAMDELDGLDDAALDALADGFATAFDDGLEKAASSADAEAALSVALPASGGAGAPAVLSSSESLAATAPSAGAVSSAAREAAPASGAVLVPFPDEMMGPGSARGPPRALAVTFINYPRAVYVNVSVVANPAARAGTLSLGAGAGAGAGGLLDESDIGLAEAAMRQPAPTGIASAVSQNLVVATPAPASASSSEPAVSVLMLEPGTDGELLESLARKFCRRLKRMVLLSCNVGVGAASAASAGGFDDGATAAAAAHMLAIQTAGALLA